MVKVRQGKAYGLKAVLEYIQNPAKTDGGLLVSAQNCLLENAFNEMMLTKKQYHKTSGRQYAHIIQAFSIDDPVTPELAHKLGVELLAHFPGFEGIVSTHIDKRHVHNHIVLNSVNHETGRKWQMSSVDLRELKEYSDKLCLEHGLSVIKGDKTWRSKHEISKDNEGRSWKKELSAAVASCIKKCANRTELVVELEALGIAVEFRKDQLMFIVSENGLKCGSNKLMPYGDFSKKNIDDYLAFNEALLSINPIADMVLYEMCAITSTAGEQEYVEQDNPFLRAKPISALEGDALKEALYNLKFGGGFSWYFKTKKKKKPPAEQFLPNIVNLTRILIEAYDRVAIETAYDARRRKEYEAERDHELYYGDEEDDQELC